CRGRGDGFRHRAVRSILAASGSRTKLDSQRVHRRDLALSQDLRVRSRFIPRLGRSPRLLQIDRLDMDFGDGPDRGWSGDAIRETNTFVAERSAETEITVVDNSGSSGEFHDDKGFDADRLADPKDRYRRFHLADARNHHADSRVAVRSIRAGG